MELIDLIVVLSLIGLEVALELSDFALQLLDLIFMAFECITLLSFLLNQG